MPTTAEKSGGQGSTAKLSQTLSKLGLGAKAKDQQQASGSIKKEQQQKQQQQQQQQVLTPESMTLPQSFTVKYLGKRAARGLWGIKHTRKPVDEMVAEARRKAETEDDPLPVLRLHVTEKGVSCASAPGNANKRFERGPFPIETVSYGVQDIVYQRVFAMIVVKGDVGGGVDADAAKPTTKAHAQHVSKFCNPFECFAFVCDSSANARRLTYALARAFQDFSKTVSGRQQKKRHFAIDLRTPQQIEEDLKREADSEA